MYKRVCQYITHFILKICWGFILKKAIGTKKIVATSILFAIFV